MCKRKPAPDLAEVFFEVYARAVRAADVRSANLMDALRELALDHDDLRQEVLVRIWIALPKYDPERASLGTYVEHVVSTTIASLLRRLKAKSRMKGSDAEQSAESPNLFVSLEFRLDFARVLRELGPLDRKVFQLMVENTPAQIARALRISRPAVYRSKARIRKALSAAGLC